MATTKQQSATRWRRILFHQDKLTPITYWGTLHIHSDFDMQKFRDKLRRNSPCDFVGFIELSKRGKRPHFHFLFKGDPHKPTFRRHIKKSLGDQKFRLQIDKIRDVSDVIYYVTKPTRYAGRSVFSVGKFFTEKTAELGKITPAEIRRKTMRMAALDTKFVLMVMYDIITTDQAFRPNCRNWWKRVGQDDPELDQRLEIALLDTWPCVTT
ncbi:hypothetical protein [Thalassoglobus sp.]|uniref:hypothetical protein n=1 Tax=Thalassoglobus sp. TaxID=2795869 RepID=UPI003AA90D4C